MYDTNNSIDKKYSNIFDIFVKDLHDETNIVHMSSSDEELEETMVNSFTNDLLAVANCKYTKSGTPGTPIGTAIGMKSMTTIAYKDMVDKVQRRKKVLISH